MTLVIVIVVFVVVVALAASGAADAAGCPKCGGALNESRLEPSERFEWPPRKRCRRCGWEGTDMDEFTPEKPWE